MPSQKLLSQLEHFIPQYTITRLCRFLANCKQKHFKTWAINHCIKKYNVDLSDLLITDLNQYASFNEFFIRRLKPESRPLPSNTKSICSPVDGTISCYGKISDGAIFQAKGFDFTTLELLTDADLAAEFTTGEFITTYLAPRDYHRVHMPFAGRLIKTIYIPGKLFSVCERNVANIPRLFARNERLVCHFVTEFGPMVVILVGAVNVASICTAWAGLANKKQIDIVSYTDETIQLKRGDECGYFQMGSTVIVLFPPNCITWRYNLAIQQAIKMGEVIADVNISS